MTQNPGSIFTRSHSLKPLLLLPLAAALAAFTAIYLYSYTHLEAGYTEEYVDGSFSSAQRVFDSAIRTSTDKLAATLTVIAQDEVLKRAMLAGDQQALLRHANPILATLRKKYGVTHFYFMRPNRGVILRVHQPERYGDVIDRSTAKQSEATGKLAAGLELGPAGTFTLRAVLPWMDGERLIGYIELGEEVGFILNSVREILDLDLIATIKKRYLSQQDWAQGMAMLNRQGEWDYLPNSVVVFQTMQSLSPVVMKFLAQEDRIVYKRTELSDQERKFRTGHISLIDARGREVGNMLLLRDVTARSHDSKRDTMLAGIVSFVLGGGLLAMFYLVIGRIERRLSSSQAEIQESTQRLSLHFQQTPLAVIEWDINFRVTDWNPAAEHIFGYMKADAIGHHAMELILPESSKSHVAQVWESLLTESGGNRSTNENITKNGKTIYCEWYNTPLIDSARQVVGVASLVRDVTEQKHATERIAYLAYYDDLTGLPSRILFKDRLSQACIEANRKERLVGVMFLDIDNFKDVNNTLGHEAGDALLKSAAKRLEGCFRPGDTVARLGGDEFAVLLADVGHVDDVVQVAQHVADSFKAPFDIFGHEVFVTFSLGITLYPFDDGSIENLMRNADSAMYAAKIAGRNCYRFYAASMTSRAMERLALQAELRHALDHGDFILHYQPQLEIANNHITGVEALVRWRHPEKGVISPAQFIPVAEETGLIVPLGEWVLRTACLQGNAWHKQGMTQVRMAVNISARQFKDPLFSQRILEIISETGFDPHYLELEITESILVGGMESVSSILNDLKRSGIMISLDDFGTGYSSLSYLKRFPIDKLKIDKSFVRDVLTDANDDSLVRAIIAMARALQLSAIAEGVETQEQLDFLVANGCDGVQGYHIGRPMPAEQAADLILQYSTI